jgi:hypothetical protein
LLLIVFRRVDWVKVPTANADSLVAVDCSIDHFSKFVFMKFSVSVNAARRQGRGNHWLQRPATQTPVALIHGITLVSQSWALVDETKPSQDQTPVTFATAMEKV